MATYSQPKPAGTPTWIDLTTPDNATALKFYQAIFGWQYDAVGPDNNRYYVARVGPYAAAGIVGDQPEPQTQPAAWHLYFATDAIEKDVERAVALGATLMFPPTQVAHFGRMAICADPTGAAFGLWQAGEHSGWEISEDAGSTAWCELYTPDAKKARAFYAALFNTTVDTMPGGMEYYVLKHGEQQLCGIMQIDPDWGVMQPMWVNYFSVANTDEAAAAAVQLGATQMGAVDDSPFGRLAALADPSGAIFKIIQPPAR